MRYLLKPVVITKLLFFHNSAQNTCHTISIITVHTWQNYKYLLHGSRREGVVRPALHHCFVGTSIQEVIDSKFLA